jgi:hypothetical protein
VSTCPEQRDGWCGGRVPIAVIGVSLVVALACAPRPAKRSIGPVEDDAAVEGGAGGSGEAGGGGGAMDAPAGGEGGGASPDAAVDLPVAVPDGAPELVLPGDAAVDQAREAATAAGGDGARPDLVAGVDLSAGLVHHWKFDEGMTNLTADSSGRGNTGTLMGGPTWVSPGAFVGSPFALSFDGTDAYVALANDLAPVLGGTASLSCWLKTTQTGATNSFDSPGITGVEMGGGSNDIFWGWLDAAGNIGLRPGSGTTVKSAAPVNDNMWHQVVMTRDKATGRLQIYVDGKLAKAGDGGQVGDRTTPFAAIGRITGSTKPYFRGQIDDVRVWDRVISAAEVSALFAGN